MLRKLFIINIVLAFFTTTLVGAQTDDLFTKKKIQIGSKVKNLNLRPSVFKLNTLIQLPRSDL